jgi:hypothetical protein
LYNILGIHLPLKKEKCPELQDILKSNVDFSGVSDRLMINLVVVIRDKLISLNVFIVKS